VEEIGALTWSEPVRSGRLLIVDTTAELRSTDTMNWLSVSDDCALSRPFSPGESAQISYGDLKPNVETWGA
jgi:hypothetical protein